MGKFQCLHGVPIFTAGCPYLLWKWTPGCLYSRKYRHRDAYFHVKIGIRDAYIWGCLYLLDTGALLWRYQSDCRTKPRVHVTLCPLSKKLSTQQKIVNSPPRLVKNSFRMCVSGASPESPRSKFAVVNFRDRLVHHTSQYIDYSLAATRD